MAKLFYIFLVSAFLTSCATLNSNTSIQPNENFILGNNKHGSFKVNLKNVSKQELQVYLAPIDGGKHSPQNVKPSQTINVKVDANTALFIVNKSSDTVSVKLKVTGDLGLSMGYGK